MGVYVRVFTGLLTILAILCIIIHMQGKDDIEKIMGHCKMIDIYSVKNKDIVSVGERKELEKLIEFFDVTSLDNWDYEGMPSEAEYIVIFFFGKEQYLTNHLCVGVSSENVVGIPLSLSRISTSAMPRFATISVEIYKKSAKTRIDQIVDKYRCDIYRALSRNATDQES